MFTAQIGTALGETAHEAPTFPIIQTMNSASVRATNNEAMADCVRMAVAHSDRSGNHLGTFAVYALGVRIFPAARTAASVRLPASAWLVNVRRPWAVPVLASRSAE
jgi:hypothetical protein